jgi:hypothetical protein
MKDLKNNYIDLFYLYTLKDPETSDIRYVGYSKRPKSRLWEIKKLIQLNKKSKKGFLFKK